MTLIPSTIWKGKYKSKSNHGFFHKEESWVCWGHLKINPVISYFTQLSIKPSLPFCRVIRLLWVFIDSKAFWPDFCGCLSKGGQLQRFFRSICILLYDRRRNIKVPDKHGYLPAFLNLDPCFYLQAAKSVDKSGPLQLQMGNNIIDNISVCCNHKDTGKDLNSIIPEV